MIKHRQRVHLSSQYDPKQKEDDLLEPQEKEADQAEQEEPSADDRALEVMEQSEDEADNDGAYDYLDTEDTARYHHSDDPAARACTVVGIDESDEEDVMEHSGMDGYRDTSGFTAV